MDSHPRASAWKKKKPSSICAAHLPDTDPLPSHTSTQCLQHLFSGGRKMYVWGYRGRVNRLSSKCRENRLTADRSGRAEVGFVDGGDFFWHSNINDFGERFPSGWLTREKHYRHLIFFSFRKLNKRSNHSESCLIPASHGAKAKFSPDQTTCHTHSGTFGRFTHADTGRTRKLHSNSPKNTNIYLFGKSSWGHELENLKTTGCTWQKKMFIGQKLKYTHHVPLSLQLHAMMTVLTRSDEVEQLILRNTDLTDELLLNLVGALKSSPSEVTLLNLNLNLIGPYGAHILLDLLRVKTQVRGLQWVLAAAPFTLQEHGEKGQWAG